MTATLTRGQSFGATETVTNTKLHNLVDNATIAGISDNEIASDASISSSKLADITTGGKVRGISLLNLPSTPSSAGQLPIANIPFLGSSLISLVSIPNASLLPLTLASWVDGASLRNLASVPVVTGQFNYKTVVSSLASGGLSVYDGSNNFIGKNFSELAQNLSNTIFGWSGSYVESGVQYFFGNVTLNPSVSTNLYNFIGVRGGDKTLWKFKWVKIRGINTITVKASIWMRIATGATPDKATLTINVGSASGSVFGTEDQVTPEEVSFTIDVSSLVDGTTYDVVVKLNDNTNNGAFIGYCMLLGST